MLQVAKKDTTGLLARAVSCFVGSRRAQVIYNINKLRSVSVDATQITPALTSIETIPTTREAADTDSQGTIILNDNGSSMGAKVPRSVVS